VVTHGMERCISPQNSPTLRARGPPNPWVPSRVSIAQDPQSPSHYKPPSSYQFSRYIHQGPDEEPLSWLTSIYLGGPDGYRQRRLARVISGVQIGGDYKEPWMTPFGKSGGGGGLKNSSVQSSHPITAPLEREEDRPLVRKPHTGRLSPNPSSSVPPQAAPHPLSTGGSKDLWTKPYHKLPDELKQHLGVNEPDAAEILQTLQDVLQMAIQAKEAIQEKRMKLRCSIEDYFLYTRLYCKHCVN